MFATYIFAGIALLPQGNYFLQLMAGGGLFVTALCLGCVVRKAKPELAERRATVDFDIVILLLTLVFLAMLLGVVSLWF